MGSRWWELRIIMALRYPDAFNPQVIGLSPLGNNAAEGVTADVILLVRVNGVPRELKVSNITQANPASVSAPANGLSNGDIIQFSFVPGMSQLIGNSYTVQSAATNSFALNVDSTSFSLFTEYSVDDNGVPYSQTRTVPLVHDPVTGTYSAKLSKVNQEERLEGIEVALRTQDDQSFLARAGYLQT